MIKDKIKIQRERLNMSQAELAELVGLKQRAISHWENGINKPDISQIEQLSEIFKVPITYWFSESEIMPEPSKVSLLFDKLVKDGIITNPEDITPEISTAIINAFKIDLLNKQLNKLNFDEQPKK
jgi:transcriptional regulator with XRE-family HTH domain